MAKPPTIHRADPDGYTECGRLIAGSDLTVQPTDGSGNPATCGTCLRQLTGYCRSCNSEVTCVRKSEYDPWMNNNGKSGGYLYWLHCPICDGRIFRPTPRRQGYHASRLEHKRRLSDQRQFREQLERERSDAAEQRRLRDEAEREEYGVLVSGCAVCGLEPPAYLPPGWHRSPFDFLKWVWCPQHAALGQEMDVTLVATFRTAASEIRAGLLERILEKAGARDG